MPRWRLQEAPMKDRGQTAEPIYARLGEEHVGLARDTDRNIEVVLMKRDFR
jgi:hypothetical protein